MATLPTQSVVENKSGQLVSIGVIVNGAVTEVRLMPHQIYGPVLFSSLTSYTRKLAEMGRISIRAQN